MVGFRRLTVHSKEKHILYTDTLQVFFYSQKMQDVPTVGFLVNRPMVKG